MEDETQLVQFGYAVERPFYSYFSKLPEPSAWNKFPTKENPSHRYKYTSIEVNYSLDREMINRQTYSFLDWLGDMGGLLDSLYILSGLVVYPVAQFALRTQLMSKIFRYRGSDASLQKMTNSSKKFKIKSTRNKNCEEETG